MKEHVGTSKIIASNRVRSSFAILNPRLFLLDRLELASKKSNKIGWRTLWCWFRLGILLHKRDEIILWSSLQWHSCSLKLESHPSHRSHRFKRLAMLEAGISVISYPRLLIASVGMYAAVQPKPVCRKFLDFVSLYIFISVEDTLSHERSEISGRERVDGALVEVPAPWSERSTPYLRWFFESKADCLWSSTNHHKTTSNHGCGGGPTPTCDYPSTGKSQREWWDVRNY
jgi:hypothetical protein